MIAPGVYLRCRWQHDVCLTRAELKRDVEDARQLKERNPCRTTERGHHAAIKCLATHHCTPPKVTRMDLVEAAQAYGNARYEVARAIYSLPTSQTNLDASIEAERAAWRAFADKIEAMP